MCNNNNKDFIDFLDSYQLHKNTYYIDNINFLNAANKSFFLNKIDESEYSGHAISKNIEYSRNPFSSYYNKFSNSKWNTSQKYSVEECHSAYTLWQQSHAVDIMLPKKTKVVSIDASINNIQDLLKIIETNEYNDDTEYNIDLKSLHNIKKELCELDNMIGMVTLKKSIVDQLLYFIQELHIGKNISEFKHTVLYGSPGTGKTEIAKIIGLMYSKLGILKNNIFKKVTRNDLIAGYLGQTAIKTKKVIEDCLGGVLFIDEAYSLASSENSDIYSKECLDTLCESLSDHKDNLMVIIAGYENEMDETFFRVNRGLESRFIWRFKIDSYTSSELLNIFKKKVSENEWQFENDAMLNEKWFEDKKATFKHYGRDMELLFSYTKIVHGRRIYGKPVELRKRLTIDDINKGYELMLNNKKVVEKRDFMNDIYI